MPLCAGGKDIQNRQDALLERLLDDTITPEVYNAKYAALQNEKVEVLIELEARERANERYFEEMELFLSFGPPALGDLRQGWLGTKVGGLKVVASNATLTGGKARLNLRPPFAPLPKMGPRSKWLGGQASILHCRSQSPES